MSDSRTPSWGKPTFDALLKMVGAGAIAYYAYLKYQELTKSDNLSLEEGSDSFDLLSRSSSSSSSSDFFWCPREFFGDVVPKLMERVPDPTDPALAPPRIVAMEYAVRGLIPTMAGQIEKEMSNGKKYPFEKVLYCNIGNPIAVGHKPYTYIRQIVSSYWSRDYASLPSDLEESIKSMIGDHRSGAYSNHRGVPGFLKCVYEFLDQRDAYDEQAYLCATRGTSVFLSDGASGGIVTLMEVLLDTAAHEKIIDIGESESVTTDNFMDIQKRIEGFNRAKKTSHSITSGVFCPIPQYPLYSATIRRLGGNIIPYELNEDLEWALPSVQELEQLYAEAVANDVLPKAFVVINPGNPSGNVLAREDLVTILQFCERHRLVLMADEVYQDNIWDERKKFYPMRRVAFEEGIVCKLASFHSCSKGLFGECGVRGGFMALDYFPSHLVKLLDKCFSVRLCPNVSGQIAIAAVCSPPTGESRELYLKERSHFLSELNLKAKLVVEKLNQLEGVTCNRCSGAMYAFPRIRLPQRAVDEAKKQGLQGDALYCVEMMNATGIVTVPGSGFKQKAGTWHFRITLLPERQDLENALNLLAEFHSEFLRKYSDDITSKEEQENENKEDPEQCDTLETK